MMRLTSLLLSSLLLTTTLPALATSDLQVGFSPAIGGASALDVVTQGIDSARHQILVAAYSFTSKPIATALVAAKKRGVDVQVVADEKANDGKYSAVTFLANQGVPVRLNGRYAIMHNKFMVIDGQAVETGSFNYTRAAAEHNAENALLLRNVPDLARAYTQDFQKLWSEGQPLSPRY